MARQHPHRRRTVRTMECENTRSLLRGQEELLYMRFDMSRSTRRPLLGDPRRFNRIDIRDGSTIETTQPMTLPSKILRRSIEKITHFQSTTSLTDHGELSFLRLNRCQNTIRFCYSFRHTYLHEHKHCQVDRRNQLIDNSSRSLAKAGLSPHIEWDNLFPDGEVVAWSAVRSGRKNPSQLLFTVHSLMGEQERMPC